MKMKSPIQMLREESLTRYSETTTHTLKYQYLHVRHDTDNICQQLNEVPVYLAPRLLLLELSRKQKDQDFRGSLSFSNNLKPEGKGQNKLLMMVYEHCAQFALGEHNF